MEPQSSLGGALCAVHPERPAARVCARCGGFACTECLGTSADLDRCRDCVAREPDAAGRGLHYVPPVRLAVMSVLTLGFYDLYWMYKYWNSVRKTDRPNIMPFWRAFFANITYGFLLSDLDDRAFAAGEDPRLPRGLWFVYLMAGMGALRDHPASLLAFLVGAACLFPAARAIERITPQKVRRERAPWGVRHGIAGLLGALLWSLLFADLLLDV